MTFHKHLVAASLSILLVFPAAAQTNQLRGLSQPGTSRLPSAQQQLNQNLNQQRSGYSFQRRLEGNNRLNRTNQINRLNSDPSPSCPGANSACQNTR
ncbi:MAG: hypothetical protein JJ866_20080 [Roseibium sp.]|uniref:hypothetical protein n=1 Tax=Roseibium sp. TaxID=1936156 RepID=UPI001B2021DD|nr:hypothetical protein [Roseibium sp.]MBO6894252.1 hypothetical protein [Roseibium sp.]MBO6932945.1 hypothetical protein [Roseibium sp.]